MNDLDILRKLRQVCAEEDKHEIEWLIFVVHIVGKETEKTYEQRKSAILNKYKEVI